MAFSSGAARKGQTPVQGKSLRRSATAASQTSRKLLYATIMLGGGALAAIWFAATAVTMDTVAAAASPSRDIKPPTSVVMRSQASSDPRVLVIDQQTAKVSPPALNEASLAAYWSRKSAEQEPQASGAEVALALPSATLARGLAGKASGLPSWHEINAAKQAGRLDILRRALAASGTGEGRSGRLDFAPPAEGTGVSIVAAAGAPLPAPDASIEIAFVAELLRQTGPAPEVAALGTVVDESEAESQLLLAENPFAEVLAAPDIEDVPLPSTRPETRVAKAVEPEKTIPMRAQREPAPREAPKILLSYARPNNPLDTDESPSLFGKRSTLPSRASKIAVYDITAGVVHMPDGRKLKASSGRGEYRDNPKFVHVRNRGSTPPNVYSLRMREARFHGIEAIRMTPANEKMMFGRDGMLTHSYLLRRRGDSSGCVVFADYNQFLNAFKRGEVKTLIVVPKLAELPKYMAML